MTKTLTVLQAMLCKPAKEISPGYFYKDVLPAIKCKNGTTLSVQASEFHYCEPRTNEGPYSEVEVWRIRLAEPIAPHFDYVESDPSGYVPIDSVAEFIDMHGGIAE